MGGGLSSTSVFSELGNRWERQTRNSVSTCDSYCRLIPVNHGLVNTACTISTRHDMALSYCGGDGCEKLCSGSVTYLRKSSECQGSTVFTVIFPEALYRRAGTTVQGIVHHARGPSKFFCALNLLSSFGATNVEDLDELCCLLSLKKMLWKMSRRGIYRTFLVRL